MSPGLRLTRRERRHRAWSSRDIAGDNAFRVLSGFTDERARRLRRARRDRPSGWWRSVRKVAVVVRETIDGTRRVYERVAAIALSLIADTAEQNTKTRPKP
jgi:hypothetical protein